MRISAARRHVTATGIPVVAAVLGLTVLVAPGSASGVAAKSQAAKLGIGSAMCPNPYPLNKIHAGLRATGYTTVKGQTPKPFGVTVRGVLHNGIAPGIDMIVISTRSAAVKTHGTWEGMSGSPIVARDGRLIGALSYGLSFGATNKAGVTPAASMYQLLSDHNVPSTMYAHHVAVPASIGGDTGQSAGDLQLLPTPITVSGLPAGGLPELRKRLNRAGAAPFSLHMGSAKGAQRRGSAASIRPGAPFATTISYGDYTIGGVGTVTAVCKGKVLAFGHPMMLSGATSGTANAARILYVQRDPLGSSFVMANIGRIVGTLDQDRIQGIRATLGRAPAATRIFTRVVAPGTGLSRAGISHTSIPGEAADAAAGTLYGNLITTVQSESAGSSTYSFTASGRLNDGTKWSFSRSNQLTDPYDVEYGTASDLYATLQTIIDNPFDALSIDKVSVHATAIEKVIEWNLHGLSVNQDGTWTEVTPTTSVDVAPGGTLQLRAHLRAYKDSHNKRTVNLTVHIPQSAADGAGQVLVSGGADLAFNGPDTAEVDSVADLLKALKAVPHNNDLVTQVSATDPASTTPITTTHHERLKKVTRGSLTLSINVATPCGDFCEGDGDLPVGA